jgi:Ca2+-dependent lipid-binding protein
LLYKDGSVNVPFRSARAVEMIDSFSENFEMSVHDFRSHATDIRIGDVSAAPAKLQLELIELQYDSVSTKKL